MRTIAAFIALVVLVIGSTAEGRSKKAHAPAAKTSHSKVWQAQAVPWGGAAQRRPRSPHPQWDVYRDNGEYAGTDPDPHVRAMLRRDDPNADP